MTKFNPNKSTSRPTVHAEVPIRTELGGSAEKRARLANTKRIGLAVLTVATIAVGARTVNDLSSSHEGRPTPVTQSIDHPVIEISPAAGVSPELQQEADDVLEQLLINDQTPRDKYVVKDGDSPASIVQKSRVITEYKQGDGVTEVYQPVNNTVPYIADIGYLEHQAAEQSNGQLKIGDEVELAPGTVIPGQSTSVQPQPDGRYTPLQAGNQE